MIERLGELNEKFFELYGALHYNDELLTNVQAEFMAKCLFEQYVAEYERLKLSCGIDENKEYARLKMESNAYTPRKRFFRKNRAMKQLISEVSVEIENYFRECEKRLNEYINAQQEDEPEAQNEEVEQDDGEEPETEPETNEAASDDVEQNETAETEPNEAAKTERKKKVKSDGPVDGQISLF